MRPPQRVTKWAGFYILDLSAAEFAELNRQVNGVGGFENFMRRLQKLVNPSVKTIKLTEADIEEFAHHAFDYDQGGWENRLLKIFFADTGPESRSRRGSRSGRIALTTTNL